MWIRARTRNFEFILKEAWIRDTFFLAYDVTSFAITGCLGLVSPISEPKKKPGGQNCFGTVSIVQLTKDEVAWLTSHCSGRNLPWKIGHFEFQTGSVLCWPTTLSHCFTGRNLTLIPEIASKEALVRSEQFYSTVADPGGATPLIFRPNWGPKVPGEGPAPNPQRAEKKFLRPPPPPPPPYLRVCTHYSICMIC